MTITLGPISFMNNTPWHMLFAMIFMAMLIVSAVSKSPATKAKLKKAMIAVFVLIVISGFYVWTLVPFSLPLLIKTVIGFFMFAALMKIAENPKNKKAWITVAICGAIASPMILLFI